MPSRTEPARRLSFLIVGTARSGTTLTQRLACELPGVRVPPETHFLNRYVPDLLARTRFPLEGARLRDELDRFLDCDTSLDLPLDVDDAVDRIGGRAEDALELFDAVAGAMAPDASILGEKTPEHLLWWRALHVARPQLRFVGVVRDPRAVVASQRKVHWGLRSHLQLAAQWSLDQQELLAARELLGPRSFLLLRYEEVVADPDRARRRLGAFLGAPALQEEAGGDRPACREMVLPWEHWKARVFEPISDDRTEAWRRELDPSEAGAVVAIAAPEMSRLGYLDGDQLPGLRRSAEELPDDGRRAIEALHATRMRAIHRLADDPRWARGGHADARDAGRTPYGTHEGRPERATTAAIGAR